MKMMQEESTYWEGKAPPSVVLGPFLAKVPSGILGPASLVALIVVRLVVNQWWKEERRGQGVGIRKEPHGRRERDE